MKISKTSSRFQHLPVKNNIHIKVQDGLFSVQGLDKWYSNWQEPYHLMLTLPWLGFIAIVSLLYELQVLRSHNPAFSLPWTLMHPIDEQSPLYGFSAESLAESQSQIIVSLSGIDETVYQNVHARHTYGANSIILNHQLVDIIHVVDEQNRYVDLASFHHVLPL